MKLTEDIRMAILRFINFSPNTTMTANKRVEAWAVVYKDKILDIYLYEATLKLYEDSAYGKLQQMIPEVEVVPCTITFNPHPTALTN